MITSKVKTCRVERARSRALERRMEAGLTDHGFLDRARSAPFQAPRKKYVVHPGIVRSRSDGDHHRISASQLIRLYRVSPAECIIAGQDGWDRGYTQEFLRSLTHLYPRMDGDYNLDGIKD